MWIRASRSFKKKKDSEQLDLARRCCNSMSWQGRVQETANEWPVSANRCKNDAVLRESTEVKYAYVASLVAPTRIGNNERRYCFPLRLIPIPTFPAGEGCESRDALFFSPSPHPPPLSFFLSLSLEEIFSPNRRKCYFRVQRGVAGCCSNVDRKNNWIKFKKNFFKSFTRSYLRSLAYDDNDELK